MPHLFTDPHTLEELEIFSTRGQEKSVFDLFNHTRTKGGYDRLKRMFRYPLSSLKDIQQIQSVIQHITDQLNDFSLPVSEKHMDQIDLYYFSKSEPVYSKNPVTIFFEGLFLRFIQKKVKETYVQGTKSTYTFMVKVHAYLTHLKDIARPELLKEKIDKAIEYIHAFRHVFEEKNVRFLTFYDCLVWDRKFRNLHKDKILFLIDLVYEIDAFISMAVTCNKYRLTFPEFVENNEAKLLIDGVYHLFVKSPVPNDMSFDEGKNFMFLTGPNMSGKTTCLKAVATAVYLAHLGTGVPAKKMKLTLFEKLFTSLNIHDNLWKGYSYFFSEVLRVKEAGTTLRSSKKALIIFDELFKGTNVKDAFDGSLLVISHLVKWPQSVFILSSHLLELEKEIKKFPNIQFFYFDSNVKDGKPVFHFKILPGISNERLGLLIMESEGISELLDPGKVI